MHHVAIMRKDWKLIGKILSGEKTIESRWYKTRRAPWNSIKKGDVVFFKDAGCPVTAKADVEKVLFFDLAHTAGKDIVEKYGKRICLRSKSTGWLAGKRYCILVFLRNPAKVQPFTIDKKGFGNANAWITVDDIGLLRR